MVKRRDKIQGLPVYSPDEVEILGFVDATEFNASQQPYAQDQPTIVGSMEIDGVHYPVDSEGNVYLDGGTMISSQQLRRKVHVEFTLDDENDRVSLLTTSNVAGFQDLAATVGQMFAPQQPIYSSPGLAGSNQAPTTSLPPSPNEAHEVARRRTPAWTKKLAAYALLFTVGMEAALPVSTKLALGEPTQFIDFGAFPNPVKMVETPVKTMVVPIKMFGKIIKYVS